MNKLRVLDLFSGIGGFSLGLERTGGFETVAFCEIDPFCQRVLAKHWPGVPIYDDVRSVSGETLNGNGIVVDAICGGFPCQDISLAGKGAGLAGARSGLWSEIARLVREIRPRYVIVKNVAALLDRGMGVVLGDLAAVGFDAEWHCLPACALGAPHRRDRVWIVAYPTGGSMEKSQVVNAESLFRELGRMGRHGDGAFWRTDQPAMVGVAHGVPAELDGLDYQNRAAPLGNSVVPQIPEMIGRAILASMSREAAE